MKVGNVVLHPVFGKGEIRAIDVSADRVVCLLGNEERFFTVDGAKSMIRAAQGVSEKREVERFNCQFCGKCFEALRSKNVHESRCEKSPNYKKWSRKETEKAVPKSVIFTCLCNETFKDIDGLLAHQKSCVKNTKPEQPEPKRVRIMHDKNCLHAEKIAPQTIKIVRNVLTARWLAFISRLDNESVSIKDSKQKFHDEIFQEFGI